MAFTEEHGTVNMRTQVFDGIVKGFALASYKFKQAVSIVKTKAWINYFFRENPDALTGVATTAGTFNDIKGIPRGAAFPQAAVTFERIQTVIEKYGLEDNIAWEDLISDEIDVRDRTLLRIAEGVAKAVDDEIWDVLTESQTPAAIQSVTIASESEAWNEASAAVIDDLLQCKQVIAEKNYPINGLKCFISPRDHRSIMTYLAEKGAQFPSLGTDTARNGNVGRLAGIDFIVSNSVTASFALVVVPKRCGTWKEMVPLRTITKEDPLKSLTIRSVEMGVTQLTDPKAVVLIEGTQGNI